MGRAFDCAALEIAEADSLRRKDGDFAVAEEKDAARVHKESRNVR
jgi:hypothetical protein